MNEMNLKISKEHAWVRLEQDDVVAIGITQFAQESMGEITYVELPEPGKVVQAGEFLCAIGSSKAYVDLASPVSGTVVAVNDALSVTPTLVNESPYEKGWFIKLRAANLAEMDDLMDSTAYSEFIEAETA